MSNLQFWLFNLVNDPYEQTNLYDSTDAEVIAAKEKLYGLLPDYMNKATTKISIKWSDVAQDSWDGHDDAMLPWVEVAEGTLPALCA